jgi:N-sulfoglucosamine sulfohydrolase
VIVISAMPAQFQRRIEGRPRLRKVVSRLLFMLLLGLVLTACNNTDDTPHMAAASDSGAGPSRPNFLFIISDDQSWLHTSRAGYALVKTPNFDALANAGLYFSNAFVSAPSCTASRAAILAGQDFWRLQSAGLLWGAYSEVMISYQDILRDAGYAVGSTGKGWGPGAILEDGIKPTGDEYNRFKRPETVALEPYDLVANFDNFLKDKPRDKPFSFWVGSFEPHRPFAEDVPNRFTTENAATAIPPFLPPTSIVQEQLSSYLSEIEYFDHDVGLLVQLLKDRGLFDNTIIVVTSDNGMEFSRGKPTLYKFGVRVPLAIYWSKMAYPSRTIDDFVSLIDIAPTFLAAAGVAVPPAMTGRSLLPLFDAAVGGRVEPQRDAAYVGYERHAGNIRKGGLTYPSRAIYTSKFTYIKNYFPDRWPVGDPPDYVESLPWLLQDPASHTFLEPYFSLVAAKRPAEELYDLHADPYQLANVIDNPDYATALAELRLRLREYLVRTADPVAVSGEDVFSRYKYYGPE